MNLSRFISISLVAVLAAFVTACVPTRDVSVSPVQASSRNLATAKAHMAAALKDPESMKIRNVSHYKTAEGDWIVCGEMDAKNSFGGYNGYSPFYFRLQGNTVKKAHFGDDSDWLATTACTQSASGTIKVAA
ncbi:hypothetical protein FGK63_20325 [Ruegeria sediminis]|uniref:Uncharacterized protein n=1 Tax=Ruegeria sediminis TaxID=2583820 RepID=A0ABY2WSW5_9RHOB|nr:hypothetical protein [Ruegeria sediminis]TMV02576.1 hypothetical protein FGK63_20325 [Ruegeria sediminis]